MKAAFLLNSAAGQLAGEGGTKRLEELRSGCSSRGIDATIDVCEPLQLTLTTRRLVRTGADVIVAAGGDGTVSAVAAGLVGTTAALGIVPFGTLNHFAKDLGIAGVEGAFDAILKGELRRVDVAEVNGRVFINNSSLGVYPEFVLERDRERCRSGARRWFFASLRAARRLWARSHLAVIIAVPGRFIRARTPFVIVGNNRYARDLRSLGKREHLDGGKLSVYTVHATSRFQLLRTVVHALRGAPNPPELEEHDVDRVVIASPKRRLEVAIDGEVVRMRPPLVYRIRPGALTVLSPPSELPLHSGALTATPAIVE